MSRQMRVCLLSLVFVGAGLLSAGMYASGYYLPARKFVRQQTPPRSVAWHPNKISVPIGQGKVRVRLADLPANADWVVGFKVDAGGNGSGAAEVAVGVVSLYTKSASIKSVSTISNLAAENISVEPGVVKVSGLSQIAGSLLIFVTLPSVADVSLQDSSRDLASGKVTSSLLIHNGVAVPQPILGVRTLLSELTFPEQAKSALKSGPQVKPATGGNHVSNLAGLSAHLLSLQKPAPLDPVHKGKRASFRVTIDETGQIVDITRMQGSELVFGVCEEALRNWRFRPFTADGQAIKVVSVISFLVGKDGKIVSPVFQ